MNKVADDDNKALDKIIEESKRAPKKMGKKWSIASTLKI